MCVKNSWKPTKYTKDPNDTRYNLISTHQRYNRNWIKLNWISSPNFMILLICTNKSIQQLDFRNSHSFTPETDGVKNWFEIVALRNRINFTAQVTWRTMRHYGEERWNRKYMGEQMDIGCINMHARTLNAMRQNRRALVPVRACVCSLLDPLLFTFSPALFEQLIRFACVFIRYELFTFDACLCIHHKNEQINIYINIEYKLIMIISYYKNI